MAATPFKIFILDKWTSLSITQSILSFLSRPQALSDVVWEEIHIYPVDKEEDYSRMWYLSLPPSETPTILSEMKAPLGFKWIKRN